MKIVAISDTHRMHRQIELPPGDVLVHAGDIGIENSFEHLIDFNDWLGTLPFKHKICIPGNHDFQIEYYPDQAKEIMTNGHLLINEEITINGIKFYGSPVTPRFHDWAYNVDRGPEIAEVWAKIPNDTDVLITHGPPYSILDRVRWGGYSVGCEELLKRITEVRPQVHVSGHIHEAAGQLEQDGILFVNASTCNLQYQPINPPITFDIHYAKEKGKT